MWPWSTQRKLDQILSQQTEILARQNYSLWVHKTALEETRSRLDAINATLRGILLRFSRPGPLRLIITGEDIMADKILFHIVLPPKSAADVVARELTVTLAESEPETVVLAADAASSGTFKGDQGTEVNILLVDIDDAGNRSAASGANFILQDTVAPPQPGELSIAVTGEEVANGFEG